MGMNGSCIINFCFRKWSHSSSVILVNPGKAWWGCAAANTVGKRTFHCVYIVEHKKCTTSGHWGLVDQHIVVASNGMTGMIKLSCGLCRPKLD